MKIAGTLALAFCLLALPGSISLERHFTPAPGAHVIFSISGLFGKTVTGTIGNLKSHIHFDPADLQNAIVTASLSPATVNTGIPKRDRHLQGPVYFNAVKFPAITWSSASFYKAANGYEMAGDLTIRDVTKRDTIPFVFVEGADTCWFAGHCDIDRTDFHVGKKSILIGEMVHIDFKIPVLRK